MNQLQMLKMALIAYVNSAKAIRSAIAHPLSIVSKKATMLKDYRIYGNSVQDGEPTPENPIEVRSVGELTKNLYDAQTYPMTKGCYVYTVTGNIIEGWEQYASTKDYIPCVELRGKTITLNHTGGNTPGISFYNDKKEQILGVPNSNKTSVTATVPDEAFYYRFSVLVEYADEAMLVEGDTAEEYEPYHKYKVPVTVRGKNLVDMTTFLEEPITLSGLTAESYGDGKIRVYGTPTVSGSLINMKLASVKQEYHIESGTVICTSATLDAEYNNKTGGCTIGYQCGLYNAKDNWVVNAQSQNPAKTLTDDIMWIKGGNVLITPKDTETYLDFVICPQLEYGNKATSFEPYIEPQTHNIYLDEPLRKVGDYADCVDFEKGVVVRKTAEKVFDGKENWKLDVSTNNNNLLVEEYCNGFLANIQSLKLLLSNRVEAVTWNYLWNNYYKETGASDLRTGCCVVYSSNDGTGKPVRCVRVTPYTTLPTIAEWKSQLASWYEEGNPFTVWYAIPTEEQPIFLPMLPQFKGTTVYEVQQDIAPSGIEVCYYE